MWTGRELEALLDGGGRAPGWRRALLAEPAHDEPHVVVSVQARVGLPGPETDGKVAKRALSEPDRLVERALTR